MFSLWKPANVTNQHSAPRSCKSSQACREQPDAADHTAVSPISRVRLENQNECWLASPGERREVHTYSGERHRHTQTHGHSLTHGQTMTQTQTHTPLKEGGRGLLFRNLPETPAYAQEKNLIQAVTLAAESMD